MPQDYYSDVLDKSDKMMEYDCEDPHKCDPIKEMTLKVKGACGPKTTLSTSTDFVSTKGSEPWTFKSKTEVKHTICTGFTTTAVASNKDFTLKFGVQPKEYNQDGMNSSVEMEAKCTPQKNAWEAKAEFKCGGFELGPIKPWTEVSDQFLS